LGNKVAKVVNCENRMIFFVKCLYDISRATILYLTGYLSDSGVQKTAASTKKLKEMLKEAVSFAGDIDRDIYRLLGERMMMIKEERKKKLKGD